VPLTLWPLPPLFIVTEPDGGDDVIDIGNSDVGGD
jgi:hypothetical protein